MSTLTRFVIFGAALSVLSVISVASAVSAQGQTSQTPQTTPAQPAAPIPPPTFHYAGEPDPRAADPGVAFVTVMDRPEVRILRVEVQPGGARRTHTHDDVTFHLLIPVNGTLEVTMGTEIVQAKPAQVYFMKVGTPHSFTNKGTSPVSVIEVFIKATPQAAAAGDQAAALGLALTALTTSGAPR